MRRYVWILCSVVLLFFSALHGAAATADLSASKENAVRLPEVDPLEVEGDLVVAGSITVSSLTNAIYKRFIAEGYRGILRHYSIGTGNGFQLFCDGRADIASASRPIKAAEVAACTAQKRAPVELRIGVGAIVMVVSAENDFVDNITLQELAAIFSAKQPIELFLPSADRTILDTIVTKIFDGAPRVQLSGMQNPPSSDNPKL